MFGKGLFLHLYLTEKSAGHLIATVIESEGACLEKKKKENAILPVPVIVVSLVLYKEN